MRRMTMIDKSERIDRKSMKIPPPSAKRWWLCEAIGMYLGHEDIYVDSHPTEAYARLMGAVANEMEKLIREGRVQLNQNEELQYGQEKPAGEGGRSVYQVTVTHSHGVVEVRKTKIKRGKQK